MTTHFFLYSNHFQLTKALQNVKVGIWKLRVLNGRTLGDLQGNYTCYTHIGASVVDYTIVSENALKNILHYKISEFNSTLSDCQCKLEWEMSANYNLTPTSS